jgi:hypothetical protein
MNPVLVGTIVFACTLGAALCGMWLRTVLPPSHLDDASKDTMKLGIGLVATMTALVLGLVTASAKSAFDSVDSAVKNAALDVLTLDRLLARYGPETQPMRDGLQQAVAFRMERIWPTHGTGEGGALDMGEGPSHIEMLVDGIRRLTPETDTQKALRVRALEQAESMLRVRWLVSASTVTSVPLPFLTVLLFWLMITFASFGLFAPRNATVLAVLVVCALSVAGSVFLVLEMDGPFEGIIKVSRGPLSYAYDHMNQ